MSSKKKPKIAPSLKRRKPGTAKAVSSGKSVRSALKAKPVDAVAVQQYRAMTAEMAKPVGVRVGPQPDVLRSAFQPPKTEQQRLLESCESWFKELSTDAGLSAAVATMIGLRRVYAVALREVYEITAAAQAKYKAQGREVPSEVADYVAQFANFQASRPFNEHVVIQGMVDTVLPWLADVVDRHTEEEGKREAEDRLFENEARRVRPLPIAVRHSPHQEEPGLPRDKTLVMVGWRNAVTWLADHVCQELLLRPADEHTYTILRMVEGRAARQDQHARLVRLGTSAWEGAATSDRTLDRMVFDHVANVVNSPIDLVVCDNLARASKEGFVGRPGAATAGDAHRRLRKWCNGMGSGLLALMPMPDKTLPDPSNPEWEQLRMFAQIRMVKVSDGLVFGKQDHYRVVVGEDVTVYDIPKEELDAYGPSSGLIVPGGA